MALKKFLMAGIVVAVLVACGDDDSSDFATRPSGDSSSACEDCDDSSSSKAKSSSSKDVISKSSDSETRESSSSKNGDAGTESGMTSSSAKSSSSEKQGDGGSSAAMTSSSAKSSSSSGVPEGYVDPSTVVTGTMTDERDGKTYKTVTIGTQTWMAENLNYAYTDVPYNYSGYTSDSTSWCYSNAAANCTKYGRLYTWAAAMDSVGTWSANGKGCGYSKTCSPTYPVRGVCPEGWHLPTQTEWKTLFTAVGGSSTAGKMLKSTSGWNSSGNGTDAYSFSALPAGGRGDYGGYGYEGYDAGFWSSTGHGSGDACSMDLNYSSGNAYLRSSDKIYGFSVRCVKD